MATVGRHWFELVMGPGWNRLHPAIQKRLNKELYGKKPVHFRGVLSVKANFVGRVFAHLADLTTGGTCPYVGEGISTDVVAFHEEGSPDMFKERVFHFPGKDWHFLTRGHFVLNKDETKAELLEYCRLGVGMKLKMVEIDGMTGFTATSQAWAGPGELVLDHKYKSETEFYYRLTMTHSIFGTMYDQEGSFQEMDESKLAEINTKTKIINSTKE